MARLLVLILLPLIVQVLGVCMVFDMLGWPWWLPAAVIGAMFVIPGITITPTFNVLLWFASLAGWVGGLTKAIFRW